MAKNERRGGRFEVTFPPMNHPSGEDLSPGTPDAAMKLRHGWGTTRR
jgi:hypothetical protein